MGRTNYAGFFSAWNAITRDLDRRADAAWEHLRIARDLDAEAEALKNPPGRDILVLNGATIQGPLRDDLIDDMRLAGPRPAGRRLAPPPRGHPAANVELTALLALLNRVRPRGRPGRR